MKEIVDTRSKVVDAAEAARLSAAGALVVSGYFDPLLASHAERLAGLKRPGVPLLVLVVTPERPILPWRARAELVASLRTVDHVAEFAGGLKPAIRLEAEHEAQFRQLLERVHARARAAS